MHPNLDPFQFEEGPAWCVLNEAFNVVEPAGYTQRGEIATVVEVIDDNRAIVLGTHRRRARRHALRAAAPREAEGRVTTSSDRPAHAVRLREDAEVVGRGGRARGGARRHVRAHRRPGGADRDPARFGRAALHPPGGVRRAQALAAQGHPALRPSGLRQDADRQGRREQPRQEHRGAHGQGDHARTS